MDRRTAIETARGLVENKSDAFFNRTLIDILQIALTDMEQAEALEERGLNGMLNLLKDSWVSDMVRAIDDMDDEIINKSDVINVIVKERPRGKKYD